MEKYYSVAGQSVLDICLNTYGSLDYLYKLLQDSGIDNADVVPATGTLFLWDKTLVDDANVQRTLELGGVKYATSASGNGNTYFVVVGENVPETPTGGGTTPPNNTVMYQQVTSLFYEVEDDNTSIINLPGYRNRDILQIERNIQPMFPEEYGWAKSIGRLSLVNPAMKGEKLYILFTQMITA